MKDPAFSQPGPLPADHKPRRRDLLLSLKYSTIEACFSVPMLNLTMPNLPFVIAFVVAVFHWKPWAVGLMAALPHWCNFAQPLVTHLLQRRLSLYQIMCLSFALSALPWSLVAWLPWLGQWQHAAFALVLVVSTMANSIASVAWSASIAEVVPHRISGKYFGRRNLIFGFWALVVTLAAGALVDLSPDPIWIFCAIFAAAALARQIGLLFLTRMKFPPAVIEPQARSWHWRDLVQVLRNVNYLWFIAFISSWGLLLNMAMPFFTVYLLHGLEFKVVDVVKLTTVASVGGLLTVKGWGVLCDRFGSRPVLHVCAVVWAVTALVAWFFAGERWSNHLYVAYFVIGAATAGFQLCQFNLMIQLVPSRPRAPHIAVFLAVTSLFTALGPSLAGIALSWMPDRVGTVFGQSIRNYHLLFVVALLGCLISARLLQRVREDAARPTEEVWRTMRTMRSFNPLLMMATVGEYFFTPRGLLAFTRQSLRSLRRQARDITDVGEEILKSGQELVRHPAGTPPAAADRCQSSTGAKVPPDGR